VHEPVSVDLEISAVTDRVSKSRDADRAPVRETLGFDIPVLINALGSLNRMKLALEVDSLDSFAERIDALLGASAPVSLLDKIKMLPRLKDLADLFPVSVRKGACQEVVEKDRPSLLALP